MVGGGAVRGSQVSDEAAEVIMKNKNNILNKYNIAWFRELRKEKESFEYVIIAVLFSLLFNVVLLAVVLVTISGW